MDCAVAMNLEVAAMPERQEPLLEEILRCIPVPAPAA